MSVRVAVILAGGESRRMNSERSKVLHEILGLPVIAHVVESARAAGITTFTVVANPKNEAAISAVLEPLAAADKGWDFVVACQRVARGTADALRVGLEARAATPDSVLVLCGDAPLIEPETLRRFVEGHEESGASVTVLSGEVAEPKGYGRILRDAAGRFLRIVEERATRDPIELAVREINSGCLAFQGAGLLSLLAAVPPAEGSGELYLTKVIEIARSRGLKSDARSGISEQEILGINTRVELAAATEIMRARVVREHLERGVSFVAPTTAYIDRRARIGRDTVIAPFVVIEGAVEIEEGCRIGPFTNIRGGGHIRAGASIGNFVEVVRSEVGAESQVRHLSYLGDTTLGSRVNVGAGTVFANWDGVERQRGRVGDGASIGSGTVVVQPAELGAGARTGAGAVVTRSVPPGETWVGVPARPLAASAARVREETR